MTRASFTLKQLRGMRDEELVNHWVQYKEGTADWHLARLEVSRRQNWANELRGWIALALSVAALMISLASLLSKN